MKQTAVEWLAKEIQEQLNMFFPNATLKPTIEQAKEMEKEQICDAYYYGIDVDSNVKSPYQAAEQYYKETFKSE